MKKSIGRPPLEPKDMEGNLSRKEIAARQRARLREAGKAPCTYWIDATLSENVKEEARRRGFSSAAELVEDILRKEINAADRMQKNMDKEKV